MKRWYVAQVYAGHEEVVKADIEKSIVDEELEDLFGEILVPSANIKQYFSSDDSSKSQLFPGYILIEMEAVPEAIQLIRKVPKVFQFLGGKTPVPLSKKEVEKVLAQISGEVFVSSEGPRFEIGSEVEISDGPFAGFVGIVDSIDEDNEKLTAMVSIFGRMTPVELNFGQLKR